jgi:hypothetical protein
MPFGLKNATNNFFRIMAKMFKEWIDQFCKIFVGDVNIHSSNWSDHLEHLRLVLEKLIYVNLKLNPRKCYFGTKENFFGGHVVN